jgi:CheY-like chemotaxis protein
VRILNVDDEPINLMVLEQMVETLGYETVAVASAAEALARLQAEPFDAVLADIHMPEIDGVEMLRRMRAMPAPICAMPVIAVTADVMSRREHEYRELGFAAVMAKPLILPTLQRVLASAVGKPSERSFEASGLGKGYSREERAWLRDGGPLPVPPIGGKRKPR